MHFLETLHSFLRTFCLIFLFSGVSETFPSEMSLADSLSARRRSWGLSWTTLWTPPAVASGPPAWDNPATTGTYSSQSPLIQQFSQQGASSRRRKPRPVSDRHVVAFVCVCVCPDRPRTTTGVRSRVSRTPRRCAPPPSPPPLPHR